MQSVRQGVPSGEGLPQAGAYGVEPVNERPVPGRRLAPGLDTQCRRRKCSLQGLDGVRKGGGLQVVGNLLHFGQLLAHAFFEGRLEVGYQGSG